MLSEFQYLWDRCLRRNATTKHRTKLLKRSTKLLNSAFYCTGLKTSKFEKTDIDKLPKENTIKDTQAEWASAILFAPNKLGSPRICIEILS